METNFKIESRSSLYFGKWQYSIAIYQSRISDIRSLNYKKIEETISYRKNLLWLKDRYTPTVIDNLKKTASFFINETDFKMSFSLDWCNIYTNDASMVSRLKQECPHAQVRYVKLALVDKPKDVIILDCPEYAYRTYLRGQWINQDKIEQLNNFFKAQHTHIRPCKSLRLYLQSSNKYQQHWLASHYFVDYNDTGYQLMLELILPRVSRKTMPIVKRINN